MILRGERPRTPRGSARGDKRRDEEPRVPAGDHKLAESLKVGRAETSASSCPASKTVWRDIEPMLEASAEKVSNQTGSGLHGRKASGVPLSAIISEGRGMPRKGVSARGLNCDGRASESIRGRVGSWSGRRKVNGTWELFRGLCARRVVGIETVKATDERHGRGRSLRSSPRTGKPSTWRRETVDTACRQEVDKCPTR